MPIARWSSRRMNQRVATWPRRDGAGGKSSGQVSHGSSVIATIAPQYDIIGLQTAAVLHCATLYKCPAGPIVDVTVAAPVNVGLPPAVTAILFAPAGQPL